MNQVNPDVSLNISPQVILEAANQGTLENVKSVKESGDALVVVTNDGHQVTVTGEEPVALEAPNKKAQSDLSQLSVTVNERVEPEKDSQATFNMSMVLSLLFELQESAAQSANLATLSNMFASLAETKSSISDLKTSAWLGLAGGVAGGVVTIGFSAGGLAGEATAVVKAGNVEVIDPVDPKLTNADMGMKPEDTELADLSRVEIDEGKIGENAKPAENTPRKANISDKEYQHVYGRISQVTRYVTDAGRGISSIASSSGQTGATLMQAQSKGHDAITKMYDTYASTETQNRSQIMSMLSSLIGIIQSAGDSQNQTLGSIGQGMA